MAFFNDKRAVRYGAMTYEREHLVEEVAPILIAPVIVFPCFMYKRAGVNGVFRKAFDSYGLLEVVELNLNALALLVNYKCHKVILRAFVEIARFVDENADFHGPLPLA